METGSQILSNTGNAALGFGTGGSDASAAPLGVIDIKDNGFDSLARLTFVKNKNIYDAKKKEADDMLAAYKKLDFTTAGLLENDRKELTEKIVPEITDYMTKNPFSMNPRNAEEIKQNIELQKKIDNFLNYKAIAQTRANYAPLEEKNIAGNIQDREDQQKHYEAWRNKPFASPVPFQKTYNIDWGMFSKSPTEAAKQERTQGVLEITEDVSTNLNTVRNSVLSSVLNDKPFQVALDKEYKTYLDVENGILAEKAKKLSTTGKTDEQIKIDLEVGNKIQPYLSKEVNSYNNYVTAYNKLHSTAPLPLIDITKPLSKEDYAVVNATLKSAVMPKVETTQKLSDVEKQRQLSEIANRKIAAAKSKGLGGSSAGYLVNVVTAFQPTEGNIETLYNQNLDIAKNKSLQTISYNGDDLTDQIVVVTADGRQIVKLEDGTLIEKIGGEKNGKWMKADTRDISVDKRVLTEVGRSIKSISLDNGEIVVKYTEGKDDTPGQVRYKPMDYLKLLSPSKGEYEATIQELADHGLTNLNDPKQMQKALELLNSNEIDNQARNNFYKGADGLTDQERGAKANKTQSGKKKLPGT